MNTPSQQNTANNAANTVVQIKKTAPPSGESASPKAKSDVKADLMETAPVGTHQITLKDTIKGPFTAMPAKSSVITPLRAANGDDDLMSQQQKPS